MGTRLEKKSETVRKRIEAHTFEDETGEEYEESKFGGFTDYFRRKKIKLQNYDAELRSTSTDKPPIFKGIVANVNGYTQPSLHDLHYLIVSYGGGFMQYLDGKTTVTHIIASNLTPKKAIEFRRYRIVKPAWVVDSIASGKLLPWERYRVLDEGVGQRLIGVSDGKVVAQASTLQNGYRDQTNASWYASQVKGVAESIDDDNIAQFPSTQGSTSNEKSGDFMFTSIRPSGTSIFEHAETENLSLSPESFDVTSSSEQALDTVVGVCHQQGANTISDAHTNEVNPLDNYMEFSRLPPVLEIDSDSTSEINGLGFGPGKTRRTFTEHRHGHSPGSPSNTKRQNGLTAEEHNAKLLSDPHVRKSSSANPEFLKQYYLESRLHHLSTWKAELKSKLQQMSAEKSLSQNQLTKRKPGSRRYIMHVDFDSFFCAVSLKKAPYYIDKPAVVAHGSGTGSEIASCNYPARAFAVKNGMWMKNALKLCPDLKILPYDFPAYEEASRAFYEAILDIGGIVQSVSVDEALVDVSSLVLPTGGSEGHGVKEGSIWREQEKADEIARLLRQEIKDRTGCAVSVGIGSNILLAKVALRKAKPAGQHHIKPEVALDFIGELLVQDLPGVAYSIGGKLEEIGVKYVKDIRSVSKERLINVLGPKTGEKIWDYSRGIDRTEIGEQVVRKSVSAEVNWGIRFVNQQEAEEFVQNLCRELHRRLLDQGVRGRQLTMKIMRRAADAPLDPPKHLGHGKCDVFNKSTVLGIATNSTDIIAKEAISTLRGYDFSPGEIRGLGVQMTKLESLKHSGHGTLDSSQKRLIFHTPAPRRSDQKETEDPIDDPDSPLKRKQASVHPAKAIAKANSADNSAKKPLNLTGTQFIMPSQVDPSVLAELPLDIRSRLLAQGSRSGVGAREMLAGRDTIVHRTPSKIASIPSQLDPEVFEALPEDVKAEVLASYSTYTTASRAQDLLPQPPSLRKVRSLPPSKKQTTPTKRRTGLLSRGRKKPLDFHSTLTQSNFVINKPKVWNGVTTNSDENGTDALDPEFLAALPEDVRTEVLAEDRRARLVRRSGLMASINPALKKGCDRASDTLGQRTLKLVPRRPKPTFTTQGFSTTSELRPTLQTWYCEFKQDGPHPDDVGAIERYLRRVTLDEKDMAKVVEIVNWLQWLIDDGNDNDKEIQGRGRLEWVAALNVIKDRVQEAVKEKGLGRLEF